MIDCVFWECQHKPVGRSAVPTVKSCRGCAALVSSEDGPWVSKSVLGESLERIDCIIGIWGNKRSHVSKIGEDHSRELVTV